MTRAKRTTFTLKEIPAKKRQESTLFQEIWSQIRRTSLGICPAGNIRRVEDYLASQTTIYRRVVIGRKIKVEQPHQASVANRWANMTFLLSIVKGPL